MDHCRNLDDLSKMPVCHEVYLKNLAMLLSFFFLLLFNRHDHYFWSFNSHRFKNQSFPKLLISSKILFLTGQVINYQLPHSYYNAEILNS